MQVQFESDRGRAKQTRWGLSRSKQLAVVGISFTLPAIIYFVWWVFGPMIYGVWLSFTNENWLGPVQFAGLSNYVTVLNNPQFWHTVGRTLIYTVESVVPALLIAFAVAWLINRVKRAQGAYITAFFLPFVVPTVASAIIFEMLLQPGGLFDQLLHIKVAWLDDPAVSMIGLAIVTAWNLVGYYVIIFLAGLQQMPAEVLEAGKIDGASSGQTIVHIVLPLLRPTILFALVTCVATVLTNFTQPYVLTNGGPGSSTLVLPLLIYRTAFQYSSGGQAATMALLLLIVSLLLTWLTFRAVGQN